MARRHWLRLVVVCALSVAGCGKSKTPVAPSTGPSPDSFNGVYTGTVTTEDTNFCGINAFQQIRGVLTVNASGVGTWTITQVDQSLTLQPASVVLSASASGGHFTSSLVAILNNAGFLVSDEATIVGKTMTLREVYLRTGSAGCTLTYKATLTAG